jgi:two-component system, NarL family, response regulator DegU
MTREIRILIADDHDAIRNDLRRAIASEPQMKIIAEAENQASAVECLQMFSPEIAILDLHMPEHNGQIETKPVGYELLRFIQQQQATTRVICLTGDWRGEMLEVALKLGAKGYVLKNHAAEEIVRAVKTVAAGSEYVSPQLNAARQRHSQHISAFIERHPGLRELTRQQLKVLKLVNEGQGSNQIATTLGIKEHTVNNYRTEICAELWIGGPHALDKFVRQHKLELLHFFAELEQSGA